MLYLSSEGSPPTSSHTLFPSAAFIQPNDIQSDHDMQMQSNTALALQPCNTFYRCPMKIAAISYPVRRRLGSILGSHPSKEQKTHASVSVSSFVHRGLAESRNDNIFQHIDQSTTSRPSKSKKLWPLRLSTILPGLRPMRRVAAEDSRGLGSNQCVDIM